MNQISHCSVEYTPLLALIAWPASLSWGLPRLLGVFLGGTLPLREVPEALNLEAQAELSKPIIGYTPQNSERFDLYIGLGLSQDSLLITYSTSLRGFWHSQTTKGIIVYYFLSGVSMMTKGNCSKNVHEMDSWWLWLIPWVLWIIWGYGQIQVA